jgi:hypothetical protein
MAIDFVHPLLKFPGRDVAVAGEQWGVLCLFEEPYRQGLRVFPTNRRSRYASIIAAAASLLRLSSLAFEADRAERTASCDLGHRGQLIEVQEL